MTTPNTV